MLSGLTKKIVFLGLLEKLEKASVGGEVETTGGYFHNAGQKFFPFGSNLNFYRKSLTRACILETYVRYENLDLDDYGGGGGARFARSIKGQKSDGIFQI